MLSICHVEELIEHVVMPPHWKFSTALPRSRRRGKGRTSRQPAAIAREFPSVTDFEREFPSLCFALATGVGKTRLMGAFISYLHQSGRQLGMVEAPRERARKIINASEALGGSFVKNILGRALDLRSHK
jgi:hypothetical protein